MRARRLAVALALVTAIDGAAACSGDGATGPKPASIAFTEIRNPLYVGQSVQLDARALDDSGQEMAAGDATWSSSNPAVALVTETGLLTGVSAGTATLQATISGRSGTVSVTVADLPPASVTVTITTAAYTPADVTVRLNGSVAFVFPATAHSLVFGASPAGAPDSIPSSASTTVRRTFTQTGDFSYTSPIPAGSTKSGVIHVR